MIKRPTAFFAALIVLAATDSFADTYIVGPGVGGGITACTHSTLQEAVDAAAAHPGRDEIRMVTTSVGNAYTAQAIVITDPELTIRGGYDKCGIPVASGRTILDGTGGAAAPVIKIERACSPTGPATDIRLEGLELVDGDNTLEGGGIYIDVCGQVALSNTRIASNQAGAGAGIYVRGHGDLSTRLLLGDEVQIEDNISLSVGGGIAINDAFLLMGGTNTVVRSNSTPETGRGGGIWLQGVSATQTASATILSGGQGDDGVISGNLAGEGGGLFAGSYAHVRMFSTQVTRPISIEHNVAASGGGISVRGAGSVEIWEGVLYANLAFKSGAAVVARDGGMFSMASKSVGNAPSGTVACIPRTACNRVIDNRAFDGQWLHGAVALVSNSSLGEETAIRFESVSILGNRGSSLFGDDCETGSCPTPMRIDLRGTSIDGNLLTPRIIGFGYQTSFSCAYCTITTASDFNLIEPLFDSNGPVSLTRSIVWMPRRDVIGGQTPVQLNASDLLVHDGADFPPSTFPAAANIIVRDPRFVDPAAGDVHLRGDSPALDIADAAGAPNFDLDGNPRSVDQPNIPNLSGPLDLGAFERPITIDAIFANGFD